MPHIFGNASALVMNAMTWYDHETQSIWSQPVGLAIRGPLKGVELELLPFQLTTWENWAASHPETLAMITDTDRVRGFIQGFQPHFVIGLILSDNSKAYYYEDAEAAGVINDSLGEIPVVLWAAGNDFNAFVRRVGDKTLTFNLENDSLVDLETGSVWDIRRGLAKEGPLKGEGLKSVPSLSAYDWAFNDFYPNGEFYQP